MASHFAEPVETNAALYENQMKNTDKIPLDARACSGAHTFPVSVENSNLTSSNEVPVVVNEVDNIPAETQNVVVKEEDAAIVEDPQTIPSSVENAQHEAVRSRSNDAWI